MRAWQRGEPSYTVSPDGEHVRLPKVDDNDMVSGEDLEDFLAAAGISIQEWQQAGIPRCEPQTKVVCAVSAVIGLVGAVLLFGGWNSVIGAAATAAAVLALAWAVASQHRARRQG